MCINERIGHFRVASLSETKRGPIGLKNILFHPYAKNSLSQERFSFKPRSESKTLWNLQMAYLSVVLYKTYVNFLDSSILIRF